MAAWERREFVKTLAKAERLFRLAAQYPAKRSGFRLSLFVVLRRAAIGRIVAGVCGVGAISSMSC